MSLKDRGIIVNLSISQWAGRKFDATATRDVNEKHNAHHAGRFSKTLLESPEMDAWKKNANIAKRYHYENTQPWEDRGPRLLAIQKYFDYTVAMNNFIKKGEELLVKIIDTYEDAIAIREKELNTLFNASDYPSKEELKRKFSIAYKFTPISDASDLRVDVSKSERKEIKENIKAGMKEKIELAKNDLKFRIHTVVKNIYEKMKDKDAKFHDSIVGNIENVISLIPAMNFDDDEAINDLVPKLNKLCVPPAKLRTNLALRAKVQKRAKKILKEVKVEE